MDVRCVIHCIHNVGLIDSKYDKTTFDKLQVNLLSNNLQYNNVKRIIQPHKRYFQRDALTNGFDDDAVKL